MLPLFFSRRSTEYAFLSFEYRIIFPVFIYRITARTAVARALNERHRQDYIRWSAPGNKDSIFRAGWLSRADRRDRYIDKF